MDERSSGLSTTKWESRGNPLTVCATTSKETVGENSVLPGEDAKAAPCVSGKRVGGTSSGSTNRNPALHVFSAHDHGFLVLFTHSGSIARIDQRWALALGRLECGQDSLVSLLERFRSEGQTELGDGFTELAASGHLAGSETAGGFAGRIDTEGLLEHHPRNLMLLVTDTCNLKCAYCYELNQGVHEMGQNMNADTAKQSIQQFMADSGSRRELLITFFGGEPLINYPLIEELVGYAKGLARELGKVIAFTMTTNLTLLTEAMADFLVGSGFTFMVSIDGQQADHDRYRVDKQGRGTHRDVVANLKMLSSKLQTAGMRAPRLRATLTPESNDPEQVHSYLQSLGTSLVEMGSVTTDPSDPSGQTPFEVDKAAIRRKWDKAAIDVQNRAGVQEELISPIMRKELLRMGEKLGNELAAPVAGPVLCGVCRNMKAVSAKGDLFPCHRYVGMDSFKIGSVHSGGTDRELVRDYYAKLDQSLGVTCSKCWAQDLCGGFCPWTLSQKDGTLSSPKEEDCISMRSMLESKLRLYVACRETSPVPKT